MDENIRDAPVRTEVVTIGDTEFTVNSLESKSAKQSAEDIIKHLILSNVKSINNA